MGLEETSFIRRVAASINGTEEQARAAIAAMREPTKAMIASGEQEFFEHTAGPEEWTLRAAVEAWRVMIDQVLKP